MPPDTVRQGPYATALYSFRQKPSYQQHVATLIRRNHNHRGKKAASGWSRSPPRALWCQARTTCVGEGR